MKFAISYSGGKDSALALCRMIKAGHEPVAMLTTINEDAGRSWFHGIGIELLEAVSESTGIPLIKCTCKGEEYHTALENGLRQAKEMGAECCVFGDIDIEDHLTWNTARCESVGLECVMPIWNEDREELVRENIEIGIKAVIKCTQRQYLNDSFLGKTLDFPLIEEIKKTGADACGENGEYHTFVYDAPVFKHPVPIVIGEIVDLNTHGAIDIKLK